jgi:hypothetical protein
MATNKKPRATTQSKDRATITQSMSFDWQVYGTLEAERLGQLDPMGRATPRSEYVALALIEKWKREGKWPPKAKR